MKRSADISESSQHAWNKCKASLKTHWKWLALHSSVFTSRERTPDANGIRDPVDLICSQWVYQLRNHGSDYTDDLHGSASTGSGFQVSQLVISSSEGVPSSSCNASPLTSSSANSLGPSSVRLVTTHRTVSSRQRRYCLKSSCFEIFR